MRNAVIGATGNVGTSVVRALRVDDGVDELVAIARRVPGEAADKTRWVAADITRDDLETVLSRAGVLIHLAWVIKPSRDERLTHRVNVEGSARVFTAVEKAGVPALVYATSVGAYSAARSAAPVDESWPTS